MGLDLARRKYNHLAEGVPIDLEYFGQSDLDQTVERRIGLNSQLY
tara:strand:- start:299 stop:433 length:135 start_codon:yes stop_codon:yes gene_type:complete